MGKYKLPENGIYDARPLGAGRMLLLGFQHMFAMFGATILVPIVLLLGVYVVLNGHLSPGGGFSGGAIMGAGLILYVTAFGFAKMRRFFTYKTYQRVVLVALLTYALSKCYSFYTGANHIESVIPLGTPGAILSSGLILVLNICVGFIVACTMYCFYAVFRKGEL